MSLKRFLTRLKGVSIVIRALTILVVFSTVFLIMTSCGNTLETGTTTEPNSPSTALGADQRRLLAELNAVQPARALDEIAGQIEPYERLQPLFVGSSRIEMKVLIITPDGDPTIDDTTDPAFDPTLNAFTFFIENLGIPFDVMNASQENLTEAKLLAANGDGRYQAIFLTDSGLGQNVAGTTTSAFDQAEWNLLWQYQREFNVRQVSLNTIPGTFPEDLGLRLSDSISTTRTLSQNITMTTEGQSIFASLKADAAIPVKNVIMNLTDACSSDCPDGVTTTPILRTATENRIIGTVSTTNDGREVLSLLMGQNPVSNHSALLSYDVIKWAMQGVFLGGREMYFQLDIDDWFQQSPVWDPALNANGTEVFQISGLDVLRTKAQMDDLRSRFAVAADLNFAGAIVGFRSEGAETSSCAEDASLTEATLCVKDDFDWVNHTYTERPLNFESPGYNNAADPFYNADAPELNGVVTGYNCDDSALGTFAPGTIAEEIAYKEVVCNLGKMQQFGIAMDPASIITSANSGLGNYNPDPSNPVFIDNGLENSSQGTLRGLIAAGMRYKATNFSLKSNRGVCSACGRAHPLFPELFLVPRYPTLLFFNATNPVGIQSQYNFLFGASSANPVAGALDLTYDEILLLDAEATLQHVVGLQPYMHFFHQANLDNYDNGNPGRSLLYDWIEAFLTYYTSFYDLPLLTLGWEEQAKNIEQKTSHFLSGTTGVWDRATGEVTLTSTNGGTIMLTNASVENGTTSIYGMDVIQRLELAAGASVTASTTDLPSVPTPNPTPVDPTIDPNPNPNPTPQLTGNLLTNGNFATKLAAWTKCGNGQVRVIRAGSADGNYAVTLKKRSGACLYQEADVVAGVTYQLTCEVKRRTTDGWSSLAMAFNDADYSNEVLGELKEVVGADYSELTLEATAPAHAELASIVLYSDDAATFDDCRFSAVGGTVNPTPQPASLLSNSGFENNLSDWSSCSGANASIVNDAASGSKALELSNGCVYQEVPVQVGQSLSLDCKAKTAQSKDYASVSLSINNANFSSILAEKETQVTGLSYSSTQVSLVVPSGGASASVTLYSDSTAQFDDCLLTAQ